MNLTITVGRRVVLSLIPLVLAGLLAQVEVRENAQYDDRGNISSWRPTPLYKVPFARVIFALGSFGYLWWLWGSNRKQTNDHAA